MKTNRFLAILMVIAISVSLFVMPTSAADEEAHSHIEIIFEDENVSDELKERAIAYFSNPEASDDGAATYGLTCTLFGHKLESTTVTTTDHKYRATAPRCLQKKYNYQACTRCDYELSTLISSTYIACCA